MSRFTGSVRTRLAAGALTLAAAGALVATGSGVASAQGSMAAGMEAHCYSAYGAAGFVSFSVFNFSGAPYERAVRVLYMNEGDTQWRDATGWIVWPAGDGPNSWVGDWVNSSGMAGWHEYAVQTYALTERGWEDQGTSLANTFQALTPGGTQNQSQYPGWCQS